MTLPLEGIRVTDFSWVVAGPFCTQSLALMGAEVIKVESSVHTDINRRLPPGADGELGTERSGLFHGLNLGKKSVTLNLTKPEARELVLDLVRTSDIVIENFAYGQLEKFDLGYERFKEVKPDIIMVSSSGLGRTGPYRSYVTFGPPLTAYTGLASITGQDGGLPERGLGGLWSDHQSGMTSLFGVLLALEHRDRTGEGQLVEYSMMETVASQLPESFIEYGCEGTVPGPRGNRDEAHCPHGVYRARGDDRWVAIAVQSNDEWVRFREIVPGPAWWTSRELCEPAARLARREEIDAVVTEWTRDRDAEDAAAELQAAGIAAGRVATIHDLLDDPYLLERDFFVEQEHPEAGHRRLAGIGWTGPFVEAGPVRHAPLLGEHNWEVLVDELALDPERFAELVAAEVII